MQVIKIGARGPSVEDIQRRLLSLGYSLSTTGVDGVFLEDTKQAVIGFQRDSALEITGEVDAHTWSLLVDSTFAFGDRVLYLRYPYFHGNDVLMLQRALNSLGFNCGDIDGIFGPYTERAVRDFQANLGSDSDGVVGAATFAALLGMKHIWDTRESKLHSASNASSLARETVITRYGWRILYDSTLSRQIAIRVLNLMRASCPEAYIQDDARAGIPSGMPIVEIMFMSERPSEPDAVWVEYAPDRKLLANRIKEATVRRESDVSHFSIVVVQDEAAKADKLHHQFTAAVILDSVCMAFK